MNKCSPCLSDYIGFVNVHKALFWVPIESITKRLRKRDPGKRIVTSIPVAPPAQKRRKVWLAFLKPRPLPITQHHTWHGKISPSWIHANWRALRKDPRHVSATSSSLQPQHIASPVWIHTLPRKNAPQFTHIDVPWTLIFRHTPMSQFFDISIGPRSGIWVRRCC